MQTPSNLPPQSASLKNPVRKDRQGKPPITKLAAEGSAEISAGQGMSDSRFRALIEKGTDIIAVVNGEGRIVYGSPSIYNYFGVSDAENLGKDAFEYIYQEDIPQLAEKFMEVLESPGKPITVQVRAVTNDRLLWLEGIVTNLLGTEGINGIVCNFRDVTERKEAERMMRESEELSRRLEQQLTEEKLLRQKQIIQATLDAQEKEREDIGRELHDNVNQILITARLYLDCINGTNPGQLPIIKRSSEIITTAIEEIRKLSSSMTQAFHKDLGRARYPYSSRNIFPALNQAAAGSACFIFFKGTRKKVI